MANRDKALPDLELVLSEKVNGRRSRTFITEPFEVARRHAEPWKEVWDVRDVQNFQHELEVIKQLRRTNGELAQEWAKKVDVSPKK